MIIVVVECFSVSLIMFQTFLRSIFGRQRKLESNVTCGGDDDRHKPVHTGISENLLVSLAKL